MKKKILSIVLVFALVFSNLATIALAAYPGESVQVQVSTDKSSVQKDEEFTLTVSFDKDIVKLGNLMIKMDYDESKVSFVSAAAGDMGRNAEDLEEAGNKFVVFLWDTDTTGVDYTAGTVAYSVTFKATAAGTAANIAPAAVINDGDFADATGVQNNIPFTIKNATVGLVLPAQTITITGDPGKTYDGTPVTDPAVAKDSADGTVTYKYYTNEECTAGETSTPPTNAGNYWVKATVSGSTTHADATSAAKAFTIGRAGYTFNYTGTDTATVGSAMPATDNSAKGTGVNTEEVPGTLAWYTDEAHETAATGNFEAVGTKTLYWVFTPAAEATNYVTGIKAGSTTFTVTALPSQVFADGFTAAETKTYGTDSDFTRAASLTTGNGAITYSSSNETVATVDNYGKVTIQGAGTANITATAAQTTTHAKTTVSYKLTVNPKVLTADDLEFIAENLSKTYDGTTNSRATVKVKDSSLVKSEDAVTVLGSAAYNSKDVASANSITFTTNAITTGNYSLAAGLPVTITSAENDNVKIDKRSVTITVNEVQRRYGEANPTFTGTVTEGSLGEGDTYNDLAVTFTTSATATSPVDTYDVTGSSTNGNYTVNVIGTLKVVPATPTYTVPGNQDVKVGSALSVFTSIAPANATGVGGAPVAGTITWYSDSNCTTAAQESDVSGLAVGATKTLYWKFVPDDTNYEAVTGSTLFTIVEGDPQTLTFDTPDSVTKIYGDAKFTNKANNNRMDGGTITYASNNMNIAEVNATTGEVTIKKAGTAVITATAAAVPGTYAQGVMSYTLTVNPKAITVTVQQAERKFGEANPTFAIETPVSGVLVGSDTVDSLGLGLQCEANATSPVGSYNVVGDGSYNANYAITINGTGKLNVTKADAPTIGTQTIKHKYSLTGAQTIDFPAGLPAQKGTTNYSISDISNASGVLSGDPTVDPSTGKVSYTLAGQASYTAGKQATFKVTATMQNYQDAVVDYTVLLINKDAPTVSANNITVIYTGEPVSKDRITGSATFGEGTEQVTVEGAWKWKDGQALTDAADSGTKIVVFVPTDTTNFEEVETTLTLTINKADVTGEPSFTKITQSGKTLADAALAKNTLTPAEGTLKWNDPVETVVVANTEYGWTFTPDNPNYNVKTGTFKPYPKSSGAVIIVTENDFWQDVQRQIKASKEGSVIEINTYNYDQMPWYIMRDLNSGKVGMIINWNGGREIYIPAGEALKPESGRLYYPLSYLTTIYNVAPDSVNPATGGDWYTLNAPINAGSSAITSANDGFNPDLSEKDIALMLPEAPADTMPSVGAASHSGTGIFAVVVAAAAVAGIFYFKKRREQET